MTTLVAIFDYHFLSTTNPTFIYSFSGPVIEEFAITSVKTTLMCIQQEYLPMFSLQIIRIMVINALFLIKRLQYSKEITKLSKSLVYMHFKKFSQEHKWDN